MTAPIPYRMRHLPVDSRGYPIPDGVYVDSEGRPHFTINDDWNRYKHITNRQCPICGRRLKGDRWFVGGPRSAFHEEGAYIDLPMHDECAHYALQVCPWLAAPSYSRRIDARTLGKRAHQHVLLDATQIPDRPPVFVAVLCKTHSELSQGAVVRPDKPYLAVEYWQHGVRLSDTAGRKIVDAHLAEPVPARRRPRVFSGVA